MDNLTIDLMIPIYYKTELRKKITILLLKYLSHIYNELKENSIIISLTVVGQEEYKKEIEEYLTFNKDNIFVIFNQNNYKINYNLSFYRNKIFQEMLHNKIKKGLKVSFTKEKYFSCFMGSNDFICVDWFLSLKNTYTLNNKQIIGIHKSINNIKNYAFFYKLGLVEKIKNLKEKKIWNGVYRDNMYKKKGNFFYFGGIIGFNKLTFNEILNIDDLWNEIRIEVKCIKNKYKIIENNNCFYLSIKSDQDLSTTGGIDFFKNKINDEVLNKKNKLLELLDKL